MRNEGSVEIDRPIEDVFRLTLENVADWSIIVIEDEVLEDKDDGGVGTTFRTVTEEHGKRMEFQGVVKRYEPPHLSAVHLAGKAFDLDIEYRFEDLSGRTRVTQESSVTPKGWMKVFFFLCGWMMNKASCKALENEFNSLKKFCEEYAVSNTD